MGTLLVKKLHPDAKLPTVAYPGEDLGYDVYALEDTFLEPNVPVIVKTGITARYVDAWPAAIEADRERERKGGIGWSGGLYANLPKFGLEVRDRSGMAAKNGVTTMAGIIDAGYDREIGIVMVLVGPPKTISQKLYDRIVENLPSGPLEELVARVEQRVKSLVDYFRFSHGSYPAVEELGYQIKAGDKIAQLLPRQVHTGGVVEVDELPGGGARGGAGYGSTGR